MSRWNNCCPVWSAAAKREVQETIAWCFVAGRWNKQWNKATSCFFAPVITLCFCSNKNLYHNWYFAQSQVYICSKWTVCFFYSVPCSVEIVQNEILNNLNPTMILPRMVCLFHYLPFIVQIVHNKVKLSWNTKFSSYLLFYSRLLTLHQPWSP